MLGQSLLLDYGDPKQIERGMETARSVIKLTGINSAGHRHIRSSYYSGTKIAEEEPWGYSKPSSILVLHPGIMLVEYNGNPEMRKTIIELADGFLAHRRKDAGGGPVFRWRLDLPTMQRRRTTAAASCRFYGPRGSGPATRSIWRLSAMTARGLWIRYLRMPSTS